MGLRHNKLWEEGWVPAAGTMYKVAATGKSGTRNPVDQHDRAGCKSGAANGLGMRGVLRLSVAAARLLRGSGAKLKSEAARTARVWLLFPLSPRRLNCLPEGT